MQKNRATLSYLLRCALTLTAAVAVLLLLFKSIYSLESEQIRLIELVSQLDVFHALFYAACPAVLLTLLIPAAVSGRRNRTAGAALACVLGGLAAAPLLAVPLLVRPTAPLHATLLIAGLYAGWNVAALAWPWDAQRSGGPLVWVRRLPLVADLLVPNLVWIAHAQPASRAMYLARLFPAALLLIAPTVPLLLAPLPVLEQPNFGALLRPLAEGDFYQVIVDPIDGDLLLVAEESSSVLRINPNCPTCTRRAQLETKDMPQALAFEPATRSLAYVDTASAATFVLDADSLELRARLPINGPVGRLGQCRTEWLPQARTLVALCAEGLHLLCADGRSLRALYAGLPGDMLYDAARGRVLHTAWARGLSAIDPQSLEQMNWAAIPEMPERMALDEQRDRLLLSFPLLSGVMILDPATLRQQGWLRAFPGVRLIKIDRERGWLLLGGLSPLLEIRDLDDFTLIDRVLAPPWMRWIDIDQQRERAYIVSSTHGLWELDLRRLSGDSPAARWRRIDPFYPLIGLAGEIAVRLLGWDNSSAVAPQHPQIFSSEPCGPGTWYEQNSDTTETRVDNK